MKTRNLAVLFVALAALAPLGVNAAGRVLEDGREVAPNMLTLPSIAGGTVAIQGCGSCKRITLTLAPDAKFFIGRTQVTFDALKRHLRERPNVSVLVVSPKDELVVTRISASDPLAIS